MNFQQYQREDRRLTLLLALEGAAQYRANHYLLQRYCERFGHSVSHDTLKMDLHWLEEQQLLTLEHLDDVIVATATTRGIDVANARTVVPGVARPQPGQD